MLGRSGAEQPLSVGSVKTNIGHLEAAAGVAGLIKAVLVLRHQAVPASLHFHQLNPHIDLGGAPIRVPTALLERAVGCVGVSSFGFSGTNAHVVLERARGVSLERAGAVSPDRAALNRAVSPGPTAPNRAASPDPRPSLVLPLSARDPAALETLATGWSTALAAPGADLPALCHTAGAGRARFAHRLAIVAADPAAAIAALHQHPPHRHEASRRGWRSCAPARAPPTPAWQPGWPISPRCSAPCWSGATR